MENKDLTEIGVLVMAIPVIASINEAEDIDVSQVPVPESKKTPD